MSYIFSLKKRKNIVIDWMVFRAGFYTTDSKEEAERIRKHPFFNKTIFEVKIDKKQSEPVKETNEEKPPEKKEGTKRGRKPQKDKTKEEEDKVNGNAG